MGSWALTLLRRLRRELAENEREFNEATHARPPGPGGNHAHALFFVCLFFVFLAPAIYNKHRRHINEQNKLGYRYRLQRSTECMNSYAFMYPLKVRTVLQRINTSRDARRGGYSPTDYRLYLLPVEARASPQSLHCDHTRLCSQIETPPQSSHCDRRR
jgi:hypothetical protein